MAKAIIVSRADYPVTIMIGDEAKVVSPREKFIVEDASAIKELPSVLKLQKV